MFGNSRRRSRQQPYPQLTRGTANPNASTAAAAAFMASNSQNPNRALSSAAAAAALRARPHTPTNVSEVQTKRTARRSSSVSSFGSAASAGARRSTQQPRLERKGSSGSMSERSFRSSSPHGEHKPLDQNHPPVPAIPSGHRVSKSASSVGVGMQNFKTASQKMESGLPSWYTQPQGDTRNVRTSDAPMRTGRPESIASLSQRPDSRSSSVNFSYPGRARAQSPSAHPGDQNSEWSSSPSKPKSSSFSSNASVQPDVALVYDPNSRRMVPKASLEATSYHVRAASEKPTKSKKSQIGVQRSGSHLAKGTVARVRGSTVEAGDQSLEAAKREQPVEETQYPTKQEIQTFEDPEDGAAYTASQSTEQRRNGARQAYSPEPEGSRLSTPSPISPEPQRLPSLRPGGQVIRKPSVVREEPEEDSDEGFSYIPAKEVMGALDNVPTRQTLYEQNGEQERALKSQLEPQYTDSYDKPDANLQGEGSAIPRENQVYAQNRPVVGLVRDESTSRRSTSHSPVRQTRFAATPSDGLVVKHTPLGRSVSPIKSALKHSSPSPRDASPSDTLSDTARAGFSSPEREAPLPRKKSVRVSFDERSPVVVGESHGPLGETDSPIVPSPQTKRPWYSSIGRNKKRDSTVEDDEVMGARPVLPSFGSVREKKARGAEEHERPLIRPHDPSSSPPAPASPELRPSSPSPPASADPYSMPGQSSDHAVGSVLAQDSASRNEANISRFREPLPPVVTSVEGYGDLSDSMKSSDDEAGLFDTVGDESDEDVIPSTQTTITTVPEQLVESFNGMAGLEEKIPVESEQPVDYAATVPATQPPASLPMETVPEISITQPSPAPVDDIWSTKPIKRQYFDIPGMFPEDDSDSSPTAQQHPQIIPTAIPNSTAEAMKEPDAAVTPSQIHTLPQTTLATTPQLTMADDTTDGESNASIYSDAYEDISDMEGDGFQSLNAVVESPITKPAHAEIPEVTSVGKSTPAETKSATASSPVPATGQQEPDWEQAKSFWRGLTTEKRRQLELEAMEDAGTEGDHEQLNTPTRKLSNRTKKTAEQRQATAVSQAAHAQAQAPVTAETPPKMKRIDPERTYMVQPGSKANHAPLSPKRSPGHMKMSLRGEQSQPARSGTLTKSNSGEVHMRKSMRQGAGASDASRRVSSPPTASQRLPSYGPQGNKAPQHGGVTSLDVAASAAAAFSQKGNALQRRGSDASDSSFKRSRAAPSDHVSFRHSMRQDTAPVRRADRPQSTPDATKGSSRFSLRSLSPSGSAFRRSSTTAPPVPMGMKRSLRSGSDSSKDSKRTSLQFPSFGRASGKAAAKKTRAGSSRFADSSEEDEPTSRFRSRFDDSSDEDDVRPSSSSRPLSKGTLRGSAITSRNSKKAATPVLEEEEEDSPDLPDSDDEPSMQLPSPLRSPGNTTSGFRPNAEHRSSSGIGTSTLVRQGSGRGTIGASTAPVIERPSHQRRGSFMSNILRRNKKADSAGKITRSDLVDSAARRDTQFERSTEELRNLRGNSRPTSPKLQKRSPFNAGDSWPLPESTEEGRPSTAGAPVNGSASKRPDFAGRRSVSLGTPVATHKQPNGRDIDNDITFDGRDPTKKKKKFGALRRMFRLDD